ncbi:MAG TPA: acetate kinase [Candidatus Marinimicrobia bacterium]|nr:acetate kinase [Candidatus Neomarinimicrobiota bacterium]HQE95692.1 acetate kinase [Candidatus Neomarinimicrobiota bacterium]HQH56448.1 acetate kinase [Candidatus Neomarinimicrobiota bacterium]HQK11485.1 acetate kinase [Candidatus Neomarinimicrobiota bacterium]
MRVLTLNSGSSSVKYQFIDTSTRTVLCKGLVDRIGISGTSLTHKRQDGHQVVITDNIVDHQTAINSIMDILIDPTHGVAQSLKEIEAVGHRLVHAGASFKQSVLINEAVREKLYECIEFAPLHNPHNIKGIEASLKKLPHTPNVGVFDTTFHINMPDYAYLYAIPYSYYEKYGMRRYGFHGTSHYYVANRAAEIVGKPIEQLNIITCHLGNGCSIAAVKGGVSVDTSMGFTPLEGLVMGTRCGDIDPGLILTIIDRENFSIDEANTFFNKQCGMKGLSELSSDMREIENAAAAGHQRARQALDIFCYRVKKYISAYIGVLNGADLIVFTGGIGENSVLVREKSLSNLENLGILVDPARNKIAQGVEGIISSAESKINVLAIPTNEELVIAIETEKVIITSQ